MFVKPARPGLIVRDPVTHEPIPETGKEVPKNSFWARRLMDGDVVLSSPTLPINKKTEEKKGGDGK